MSAQRNLLERGLVKTRHMVLLVHLDEQRSVLGAARAAHMTQPAASRLLGELEQALGVPLFRRHARGVEPTWYGEVMVRHARAALTGMRRAQDEIAALQAGLAGQVAIGAVVNPGINLVPAGVALLKQRHPGIAVRIEIDSSDVLIRRLHSAEFDIVVARPLVSHGDGELAFERLAGEAHRVIARAGHPLAARKRLHLRDLADPPWILPPAGSLLRDKLDAMFASLGAGLPRNVVETASLPVITSLLQRTDMVAPLQVQAVDPYVRMGVLRALDVDLSITLEPFGIVTRRDREASPADRAALDALRRAAARLHPG